MRPVGNHLDMFQHIYSDWNQRADHLSHVAGEKAASWNSFMMDEADRLEPVRAYFNRGVLDRMLAKSSESGIGLCDPIVRKK